MEQKNNRAKSSSNKRKKSARKRKTAVKKQALIKLAAVTVVLCAVIGSLVWASLRQKAENEAAGNSDPSAEESGSVLNSDSVQSSEGESQSVSEQSEESQSEEKSSGKEEQSQKETQPSSHTNSQSNSFYSGVSYRSPTAKTADIFKHGRELMLLNNDYELPEDFKWDLVYWSNGKSVDALSLNSQKYDSVKAVDRAAYQPLKDMFSAAQKAGVPLELVSPYRSIDLQDRLFSRSVNSYMNQGYSKEQAVKKANYARTFTGTSEHNTGLGFDILQKGNFTLSESFENTAQFKWLSEHAEEYGFILRYRKDKISQTGIMYEPWHYRYVGVENAKKINELDMCLEEYIEYLER